MSSSTSLEGSDGGSTAMELPNLNIRIEYSSGNLRLQINERPLTTINYDEEILDFGFATASLFSVLKEAFLELCPYRDRLKVQMDKQLLSHPLLGDPLKVVLGSLEATHKFLLKLRGKRQLARTQAYEGILFLAPEAHSEFEQAFERLQNLRNQSFYKIFQNGFDPQDLLATIEECRICRLVTLNQHFDNFILAKNQIYLPAVLSFLGIERILFDLDSYDAEGFIARQAFHDDRSRRFSTLSHLQEDWDSALGLKNIAYVPSGMMSCEKADLIHLESDFSILISADAHIEDVLPFLPMVVSVLDECDPLHYFEDFQRWYLSMRQHILETPVLSLHSRDVCNRFLYRIYLSGLNVLQYETLQDLLDLETHPVQVFGSDDWKVLFPEIYQGRSLSDEDFRQILKTGKFLPILMGRNSFYLENSEVFHQVLMTGVPFLMKPAIAVDSSFQALQNLEFRNSEELFQKINQIGSIANQEEVTKAREALLNTFEAGSREMLESLAAESSSRSSTEYPEICQRQNIQLKAQIRSEIQKNSARIERDFHRFFQDPSFEINLAKSRFLERPYFQKLLRLQNQQ